MGDTAVSNCYRPPDHEEQVNEALYRQAEATSHSQAPVLTRDLNQSGIKRKDNTGRDKQFRAFLQSTDDKFLTQVIEVPTTRDAVLDLILLKKEGLLGDLKVKGSLKLQ